MKLTKEKQEGLAELLGLPTRLSSRSTPTTSSVAIDDVVRLLELPPPPKRELLGPDRWLAGSTVTRWLCGGWEQKGPVDYDFCFASLEALHRTAREWMEAGFTFRAYWTFKTICLLCGRAGQLVRRDRVDDLSLPLPRVRCGKCGEFGGVDAATLEPERLLRVTPELVAWSGMRCLELLSPEGEVFQLSTLGIGPTPNEVLAGSDFSITQFAIDDRTLYFAPYAWTDLLRRRLRLVRDHGVLGSYGRLWKYTRRGFRPYLGTVLRFNYYFVQRSRWHPVHQ